LVLQELADVALGQRFARSAHRLRGKKGACRPVWRKIKLCALKRLERANAIPRLAPFVHPVRYVFGIHLHMTNKIVLDLLQYLG